MKQYFLYIKIGVIIIAFCGGVWLYKDYQFKSFEKDRYEENERQKASFDSLRISSLLFNQEQMKHYIKDNKELLITLKENKIKMDRVTSVMNHLLTYRDTTIVNTDLSSVLEAINKNKPITFPIKDSTSCLTIKGNVNYSSGLLSLNITDRIFTGNTTAIGYWQHRQWKLLWFKTRFLGKKEGKVKIIDKCGESTIINIEKSK